jgi:hypothetical protein
VVGVPEQAPVRLAERSWQCFPSPPRVFTILQATNSRTILAGSPVTNARAKPNLDVLPPRLHFWQSHNSCSCKGSNTMPVRRTEKSVHCQSPPVRIQSLINCRLVVASAEITSTRLGELDSRPQPCPCQEEALVLLEISQSVALGPFPILQTTQY